MSSYNRRSFLISLVALTGCGFTPSYGPNGVASALARKVTIDAGNSRNDYTLFNALERRFGPPQSPTYALSISLTTSEDDVGVTRAGAITRYHVTGEVTYRLTENATGETRAAGKLRRFSSYSATKATVASLTSTRDTYDRLMEELASAIEADLIAKLGQ